MRYVCEICGYETEEDEELLDEQGKDDFFCPVCGSDRELFYPEPMEYSLPR